MDLIDNRPISSGPARMWTFVILYMRPPNAEDFLQDYKSVHVPFGKRFPHLQRWTISVADTAEEGSDEVFMISTLYFNSLDELRQALKSPERATAFEDSKRFQHYQLGRYVCEVTDV